MKRMQRVFMGLALAGLTVGGCSSASGQVSGGDGGDARADTRPDTRWYETFTDPPPPPTDHVGGPCSTDADCDLSGNGYAHCTVSGTYIVGPLNPTPMCVGFSLSGADVCDPGTLDAKGNQTQIVGCDGNTGLCVETPSGGKAGTATCDPFCQMDDTGHWLTQCLGKNACQPAGLGTDAATAKNFLVGTCQGGCSVNADCPTGSVCDDLEKICVDVKCADDATCKSAWSTAPASWKCDTGATSATKGFCTFQFAKGFGDLCDPNATVDECLCIASTGATQGVCGALCTTGRAADCPTGFVCDPLLNVNDSVGKPIYAASFALPGGVGGVCTMTCAADADCLAGQKCALSAGMGTQKTCR